MDFSPSVKNTYIYHINITSDVNRCVISKLFKFLIFDVRRYTGNQIGLKDDDSYSYNIFGRPLANEVNVRVCHQWLTSCIKGFYFQFTKLLLSPFLQ